MLISIRFVVAQDLPPSERIDHDGCFGDPYIKVSLDPTVDERVRQSSVKRKTANPFYNEYFKFPATYDDIKESTIVFNVFDYDKFSRHKLVGEVRIDLSKVETSNSVEMWCDVQKQNPVRTLFFKFNKKNRTHVNKTKCYIRLSKIKCLYCKTDSRRYGWPFSRVP